MSTFLDSETLQFTEWVPVFPSDSNLVLKYVSVEGRSQSCDLIRYEMTEDHLHVVLFGLTLGLQPNDTVYLNFPPISFITLSVISYTSIIGQSVHQLCRLNEEQTSYTVVSGPCRVVGLQTTSDGAPKVYGRCTGVGIVVVVVKVRPL